MSVQVSHSQELDEKFDLENWKERKGLGGLLEI